MRALFEGLEENFLVTIESLVVVFQDAEHGAKTIAPCSRRICCQSCIRNAPTRQKYGHVGSDDTSRPVISPRFGWVRQNFQNKPPNAGFRSHHDLSPSSLPGFGIGLALTRQTDCHGGPEERMR